MRSRTIMNTLLASGLALAAGATHAVPTVTFAVSPIGTEADMSAPAAARSDFLATLDPGYVNESFEGFAAGARNLQFTTAVGAFTQAVPGDGGGCEFLAGGCSGGLSIFDDVTSVYPDQFAVDGTRWLDNAGTQILVFEPVAGMNAIGFYVTDMGEAITPTTFTLVSGNEFIYLGNVFGDTRTQDASLAYLTFNSSDDIQYLLVSTNAPKQGYGIDSVTVGRTGGAGVSDVPEPGTMGLLALGLVGVATMRRRRA